MGVIYVILGLAAAAAPGFEVFPFFCWFLFPVVPGHEAKYELIVTEVEGDIIHPPTNYQKLDRIKDPMAMDLWLATQRIGHAIDHDNSNAALRTRALIEANFLCGPSQYHIDRVYYDPLVRWREGRDQSRETIATYTNLTPCPHGSWAQR